MANQKFEMSLASALMALLVITMTLWHGTMAQSSDCTNAIISMSSCLNYIQGNTSTPSSGCCSQLSNVVSSQPQCLCQVLNGGGSSLGLNINQTQALQLPKACKVQTPPVSQCNTAGSPPAKSPGGKAPASPTTVPSAGKGSNSVPTTDTNSSDANTITMGAPLMTFFILFMASLFISV